MISLLGARCSFVPPRKLDKLLFMEFAFLLLESRQIENELA
jgi:hypothetical protein